MSSEVYRPAENGSLTPIGKIQPVKMILFTCEDGTVYGLPLKEVAEARAKYYADKDKDTTFQEELDYVMNDPWEGIDWFRNQQNPEDFAGKYCVITYPEKKTIEERVKKAEATIAYRDMYVPKE